jgi:hypothetical protein
MQSTTVHPTTAPAELVCTRAPCLLPCPFFGGFFSTMLVALSGGFSTASAGRCEPHVAHARPSPMCVLFTPLPPACPFATADGVGSGGESGGGGGVGRGGGGSGGGRSAPVRLGAASLASDQFRVYSASSDLSCTPCTPWEAAVYCCCRAGRVGLLQAPCAPKLRDVTEASAPAGHAHIHWKRECLCRVKSFAVVSRPCSRQARWNNGEEGHGSSARFKSE